MKSAGGGSVGTTSVNGFDDDFKEWNPIKTWRSEYRNNCCSPIGWRSIIPISLLLVLIILAVLLSLMNYVEWADEGGELSGIGVGRFEQSIVRSDMCSLELVESIPEGMLFLDESPKFRSTFQAWMTLLELAQETIEIGSFYWTLKGADVYNHSSARKGEIIFSKLLEAGTVRKLRVKIVQSFPTSAAPNKDTDDLREKGAAQVRSIDFPRLFGSGVLHTKVWLIDRSHFYIGSANMDWRSLTQVKELGVLGINCTCLVQDLAKIFDVYWDLGVPHAQIPPKWPKAYAASFNYSLPAHIEINRKMAMDTYFSSSPPKMSPLWRTDDLFAIIDVISKADRFVYISVMDYYPMTLYTPTTHYWPYIDDALRTAAIERKVSLRLLVSLWNHSKPSEDYFLHSLEALSNVLDGVDIQIRRFIVPGSDEQKKIPFGRVNHDKYMVTDTTAYIGTSNWVGDYFINTAGIGMVISSVDTNGTIIQKLQTVFERDWNSKYAVRLS